MFKDLQRKIRGQDTAGMHPRAGRAATASRDTPGHVSKSLPKRTESGQNGRPFGVARWSWPDRAKSTQNFSGGGFRMLSYAFREVPDVFISVKGHGYDRLAMTRAGYGCLKRMCWATCWKACKCMPLRRCLVQTGGVQKRRQRNLQ